MSITFTTVSVSLGPEEETYPVSAGELLMYQVREAGGDERGLTHSACIVSPTEYLRLIILTAMKGEEECNQTI